MSRSRKPAAPATLEARVANLERAVAELSLFLGDLVGDESDAARARAEQTEKLKQRLERLLPEPVTDAAFEAWSQRQEAEAEV